MLDHTACVYSIPYLDANFLCTLFSLKLLLSKNITGCTMHIHIVDLLPHLCMPFKPYLLVFTYNYVRAYYLSGAPLIFVAIGVGLRLDQYGTAE